MHNYLDVKKMNRVGGNAVPPPTGTVRSKRGPQMDEPTATPLAQVKGVYARLADRVAIGRRRLGRPLTFAEKVLLAHLHDPERELPQRCLLYTSSGWMCSPWRGPAPPVGSAAPSSPWVGACDPGTQW